MAKSSKGFTFEPLDIFYIDSINSKAQKPEKDFGPLF